MSDSSVQQFADRYPFPLDAFQLEAIEELSTGGSVMVAAPTGTGKTVVAEYGVFRARSRGRRALYTTPIKALSNQKFRDFRREYGQDVGLMTGDIVENGGGSIIVMTTEVVRNMLIQSPDELADVDCIVFDEVHFLADPSRGTTWEEAIICAPPHVQLICLSATVSNAGQVADWISEVHRPIRLIVHRKRSVPLDHFYFLDNQLLPLIDQHGQVNRKMKGIGGENRRALRTRSMSWSRDRSGDGRPEPRPPDVVRRLRAEGLLPGIYFFFSRRECERAAELCVTLDLASGQTSETIAAFVEDRLGTLSEADRSLGQVVSLRRLLPRGVGFHHAGLLPVLKVLVEELFNRGLLQIVFATDTLSLGINMPAKTVVIGELTKFDGESRRPLTPNEYQQLTGRAGRRGLDERGVAVVPYSPWVEVEEVIAIGTGDLLPIESTFTLRYNTVLNLWDAGPNPTERLAQVFASSLREFQLDDVMKARQDEIGVIRVELNTLSKEQLNAPARGRDARKRRGSQYASRYTHRDLLQDRFAELEQDLLRARQAKRNRARRTLRSLERVLEQFNYLRDGRPTDKAAGLRELYDGNGLILAEAVARGLFRGAEPAEIMEVLSWFCYDRDKSFFNRFRIAPRVWEILQRLERVQDAVLRAEADAGLALTPGFTTVFSGIAYAWCQGLDFGEFLSGIGLPEGDVMLTFNKTLDLGRQLRDVVDAVDPSSALLQSLADGERLMRRGIVALCCNVSVPISSLDGQGTADDAEMQDVEPSGRLSIP